MLIKIFFGWFSQKKAPDFGAFVLGGGEWLLLVVYATYAVSELARGGFYFNRTAL